MRFALVLICKMRFGPFLNTYEIGTSSYLHNEIGSISFLQNEICTNSYMHDEICTISYSKIELHEFLIAE